MIILFMIRNYRSITIVNVKFSVITKARHCCLSRSFWQRISRYRQNIVWLQEVLADELTRDGTEFREGSRVA